MGEWDAIISDRSIFLSSFFFSSKDGQQLDVWLSLLWYFAGLRSRTALGLVLLSRLVA